MFDFLSDILGLKNPAEKASPYLNQIEGKISPYYQPYINAGRNALSTLQDQYGNLINDPAALMNKFGAGYQKSPGYQFQMDEGTRAMNQGAAAGGMVGSPQEQAELAKYSQGLASQDYGNYLNNIMGMYRQGLQGMGGINEMGYGASTGMAGSLKDMLESQANLAYAGQASQNKNWADILGSGLGFLSGGGMGGGMGGLSSLLGGGRRGPQPQGYGAGNAFANIPGGYGGGKGWW